MLFWAATSKAMLALGPANSNSAAVHNLVVLSIASVYLTYTCQAAAWMLTAERSGAAKAKFKLPAIAISASIQIALFVYARFIGGVSEAVAIVSSANLVFFAILLGSTIVFPLKRAAELVPVCVVMALADLFSVVSGPTKAIVREVAKFYEGGMTGKVPFGDFLLVKIGLPGYEILVPVIGVADFVMLAFLCAAALKFGMNDNLAGPGIAKIADSGRAYIYIPVAIIGLIAALAAAQLTGVPIPALILLAAVFLTFALTCHPATRRMTPSDVRITIVFAAVLLSLLAFRAAGF